MSIPFPFLHLGANVKDENNKIMKYVCMLYLQRKVQQYSSMMSFGNNVEDSSRY